MDTRMTCWLCGWCVQTPHQQTDKLDLNKHPDRICGGGGFGPVSNAMPANISR